MNEEVFDKKLRALIQEIAQMPKDKQKQLSPLVAETKARHKKIKSDVNKMQQSLSTLRICIKYLLFDLEATKRERDKLQLKIDNQGGPDDEGGSDQPNEADGEI